MSNRRFLGIIAVLLLTVSFVSSCCLPPWRLFPIGKASGENAIWVNPPVVAVDANCPADAVGYMFNVTVYLNASSAIFLYQVGLLYNRTLLRAVQAGFTAGLTSEFMEGHETIETPINIDSSLGNGSVQAGESLMDNDVTEAPRCGSLIWVEFEVVALPKSKVTIVSSLDITTSDATFILDHDMNDIPVSTIDGTCQFIPDTTPPAIIILSPADLTYTTGDVSLSFTVNESTSWIGYSADGQDNVTINGNTTLSGLSNGPHVLVVYANDTYDNMGVSSIVNFSAEFKVDLSVASPDITFSDENPSAGEPVTIAASVHNDGTQNVENISVEFFDGDVSIGEKSVLSIPYSSSSNVSVEWVANEDGFHLIKVVVNSCGPVNETDTSNNVATRSLLVGGILQYGAINLTANVNSGTHAGAETGVHKNTMREDALNSGDPSAGEYVTYNGGMIELYGNTTYETAYGSGEHPAGADVTVAIEGWVHAHAYTITDGTYGVSFNAPYSPGNYTISVTVTDHTFTASIEITLTVLQVEGVDLTLSSSDISFLPLNPVEYDNVGLKASVNNVGTLAVFNVSVAFYVDNRFSGNSTVAQVPPSGSAEANLIWNATPWGFHTIKVVIDPDNQIAELSKENNEASKPIYVSPGLPDLTPINIWFSNSNPLVNDTVGIYALLENIGGVEATNVETSFYSDGQSIGNVTVSILLGEGGSQTASITCSFSSAGQHEVTVVVDPENQVFEADERNNQYCTVLNVHLPLPDLALSSSGVTFSNADPRVGDSVTIFAAISNVGEEGAGNISVSLFDNALRIADITISFLDSNAQMDTNASWTNTTEGWHWIRVVIDENNTIVESNKNNNQASKYVYVAPLVASDPCVYSDDIVFSDTCPEEGKTVTVYATIHNTGEVDAGNVTVAFYIDAVQLGSPMIVQSISVSGECTVWAKWVALQVGSHVATVRIDADGESNKNNNVATRAIVVGFHDLSITEIAKPKTVVGQGFSIYLNATVLNQGYYFETFNVTLYVNSTAVNTETLALDSNQSATLTFNWNTSSFSKGNWTISAYAWPVKGETDKNNNLLMKGWVIVSIVGDISGLPPGVPDGKVDMRDIGAVARLFLVNCPNPLYNPNYDINGDGKIDMRDIGLAARHFGDHYP